MTGPMSVYDPSKDPARIELARRIDEAVCGWSMIHGHAFTEAELDSLVDLLAERLAPRAGAG